MTDERRRIDVLLDQVTDRSLRERLASEIGQIAGKQKWGLNFEEHLPEGIRIPNARVRRGVRVQFRDDSDPRYWEVTKVVAGIAALRHDDETREAPLANLVVARVFDEPVYPGFTALGKIERGGEKPHHLVIEGENYHALETLRYSHDQKVDVIYIDPPYNTGAGGWIYNDRYVGDADTYRHSKWLSFMQKRLELARHLLTPTGVIIVAIDDNEHHRLRALMDDVLGENNFISNVVWQGGRKNDSRFVSNGADYMLVYAKSVESLNESGVRWREPRGTTDIIAAAAAEAWEGAAGDKAEASRLMKQWIASLPVGHPAKANNRFYDFDDDGRVYRKRDISWPGGGGPDYDVLHPDTELPVKVPSRGWVYSDPARMQEDIDAGLIHWGVDHNDYINRKTYLDESDAVVPTSVFEKKRTSAGNYLSSVLGSKDFPFPKDVDVLARWINIASAGRMDAVVLDFFAGTGTTAEAVMRLNAADGGHRQSIIVTNNEVGQRAAKALAKAGSAPGDPEWEGEGVFEKVTRPRIETVVTGIRRDGSRLTEPVLDAKGKKIASGIPGATGYDENVAFLKLDYLDRDDIAADDAFRQIAQLLWVKAGGRGPIITERAGSFAAPEGANYAVLFKVGEWAPFVEHINAHPEIETVYVVSDSESTYGPIVRALRPGLAAFRLYENYLTNFEINVGGR
ncbi:site-specific DNA-methyltransferase [Agromyces sp. GXS1127]|uniref:site-specific DNA-methyltransferase n=1 Tax=Agromyces sp. GXS1127 TaxID=3424181 RepID=UPI003D31DDDC